MQTTATGENRIVNNLLLTPGSGGLAMQVDGGGRLTLEGVVAGSGTMMKTGTGTLRLAGVESNTDPVAWTVTGGELELGKAAGNAAGGTVTIGDGTNAARLGGAVPRPNAPCRGRAVGGP